MYVCMCVHVCVCARVHTLSYLLINILNEILFKSVMGILAKESFKNVEGLINRKATYMGFLFL